MDNPNNIEELFKSLEHYSEEPAEKVWTRLERTFNEKKKEGALWLFTDVCIVGIVLFLSIWGPAVKNSGLNAKQTSASLGNNTVQLLQAKETATHSTHKHETEFKQNVATKSNNIKVFTTSVIVKNSADIIYEKPVAQMNYKRESETINTVSQEAVYAQNAGYLHGINAKKIKPENLNAYFKTYELPVLLRPIKQPKVLNTQYLAYAELYTGITELKKVQGFSNPLNSLGVGVGLLKQVKLNSHVAFYGGLGYEFENLTGRYTYQQPLEQQKDVLVINGTNNIKSFSYNDTVLVQRVNRVNIARQSLKIPVGLQFTCNKWSVAPQFNVWVNAPYRIPAGGEMGSNGPVFKKSSVSLLTGAQLSLSRSINLGSRSLQAGLFVGIAGNKAMNQKQVGLRTTFAF